MTFYHVIYSFIIVVALTFYFIPTLIAVFRKHEKAVQIFLLNIFLGWTLVGWVVALIWSVKNEEKEEKEEKAPANDSEWFESELLAEAEKEEEAPVNEEKKEETPSKEEKDGKAS